jgi:nicotinamide phosphoribosyltransferase
MYPENTQLVFSNFTPRSVKYMPNEAKKIVVFGIQYAFKYIDEIFRNEFFNKPKNEVISEAKEFLDSYLGTDYDMTHFEKLHDLGYLPIKVMSLPEGSVIEEKIPILVYWNTNKEFFWLTNYLETLVSTLLWKPLHSASMAFGFKQMLEKYCLETNKDAIDFVDFQGHDFSMRGMQSPEASSISTLGFLTSFKGTDTIPGLYQAKKYYNSKDVAFSCAATEHAVATSYGKENEEGGFSRILKVYPDGIVSLVSDSYDFWKIHTETIYKLKEQILSRNGKTVFRGDSGDPVDIVCGIDGSRWTTYENKKYLYTISGEGSMKSVELGREISDAEIKGQIELLWDCFGGTINEQGYKILNEKVGAIYGDGMNFERINQICKRLEAKGFASTNVVFGIGSMSLSYATRDSQGCAVKATYCEILQDNQIIEREIFKDPITDDGTKKSAKGLLSVFKDENNKFYLKDQCSWNDVKNCEFQLIYENGNFYNETTMNEIRNRIKNV